MTNRITLLSLIPALLLVHGCATNQQAAPASPLATELTQITALFDGRYDGSAPAPGNPDMVIELTHSFDRVEAPQFGELVYYYALQVNGQARQQKLFVFDTKESRTVNSMLPVLIPNGLVAHATDQQAEQLAALDPTATLIFPPQCILIWSQEPSQGSTPEWAYSATVLPENCEFESIAFGKRISAYLRYEISSNAVGWTEKLTSDSGEMLTETGGRLVAIRSSD